MKKKGKEIEKEETKNDEARKGEVKGKAEEAGGRRER